VIAESQREIGCDSAFSRHDFLGELAKACRRATFGFVVGDDDDLIAFHLIRLRPSAAPITGSRA
jgi:hypothetical protein